MVNIVRALSLFSIAAAIPLISKATDGAPPVEASPMFVERASESKVVSAVEWRTPSLSDRAEGFVTVGEADRVPVKTFAKIPVATADGQWIMRYEPLLVSTSAGGCTMTVTSADGSEEVDISDFWRTGTRIKGRLDKTAGVLKIPYQFITTHNTYGKMNISVLDHATGRPLTTDSIEFHAMPDGSFVSDTWWGIVVTTGDNRGEATDAYLGANMMKGNATMSTTDNNGVVTSYPVIVTQPGANLLSVANFRNYGLTVDIRLNSDRSAVIPHQVGYASSNARYYTVGCLTLDDKGNPASWQPDIPVPSAQSSRKLEWSDWTMIFGNSYWTGYNGATVLECPFDISFPAAPAQSDFQGEGTAQSPYLISSVGDMVLLCDKAAAISPGTEDAPAQMWEGKYFRVTADIDMGNYRLSAMTSDKLKVFAADFDGDNHTISNFSIIENRSGYVSLFGAVGSKGVIRNLRIANAVFSSISAVPAAFVSENDGKIINCHLSESQVSTIVRGAGGIAGISAYTDGCSVVRSRIMAEEGFTGGVVAQLTGPLANSWAEETVVMAMPQLQGGTPMGGLVGASNYFDITDCYFQGIVTTAGAAHPTCMGGIVGNVSGGKLTRCMASAQLLPILVENQITGGIAGGGLMTMTDCLSASWIRSLASQYTGGLVGLSQHSTSGGTVTVSRYSNSISLSRVEAMIPDGYMPESGKELVGASDPANPAIVTGCHFDRQLTDFGSARGLATETLTAAAGLQGFDTSVWTFGSGLYPRLKAFGSTRTGQLASSVMLLPVSCTYSRSTKGGRITTAGATKFAFRVDGNLTPEGRFGAISGNEMVINDRLAFGTDTIVAFNGDMQLPYPITLLPIPYEGEGTAASPYLLKTKEDMIALGSMTTTWGLSYADMHFLMANDIDMEYTDNFRGLSYTNSSTNPILFASTFDGGGHKISRMRIGDLVWKVKPEDDPKGLGTVDTDASRATWIGFVGRLGATGVVRNLTIAADCRFEAFASVGAIAGWNNGLIENCSNFADIQGQSSWIGGIAGQTLKGSRITGCFNGGNISTGYRNAGGIVSTVTQAIVDNCANVGDVSAREGYQLVGKNQIRYAGGITGTINGGRVENCLNAGNILALEGYAGGIAGNSTKASTSSSYTSDLIGCLSYGSVDGNMSTTNGGLIGESLSDGKIMTSYFDCQTAPYGALGSAEAEGAVGQTAAQLVGGTLPAGLDASIWSVESGRYPVMKAFEKEPLLIAASQVYIDFPAAETALDMKGSARLSQPSGITWKLASAKGFSISGSELKVPSELTAITSDTVSGSLGGYTKNVRLRAVPQLALSGQGTQTIPYLISSASDWNLLADYMAQTLVDYRDNFFKVSADIDFAGGEMKSLGSGAIPFEATLDGDGRKISGFIIEAKEQLAGPFAVVGASSTVKNLTLAGKVSTTATVTKSYIGGFAGKVLGKLIDCVSQTEVSTPKGYAGGFAGTTGEGASFIRCVNKGELKVFGNFGGIAGEVTGRTLFEDCVNEGILNDQGASSTYANYVGGIAGRSVESDFIRCINRGEFRFATPEKSYGIGGMVGYLDGKKDNPPYVFASCVNESDIEAGADLGGLTGSTVSTVGAAQAHFTDCVNNGDIRSKATSGSYAVGGISAKYKPGFKVIRCVNNGNVSTEKQYGVGGIVGNVSGVPTAMYPVLIDSCLNTGDIRCGNYMAGGIISNANAFTTVCFCGNTGRVESAYGVGGICGALYGATGEIIDCWNSGDVAVTGNRAGGIVGYANNGGQTSKITGCLNMGDVSTSSTKQGTVTTVSDPSGYAVGGIAGLSPSAISGCVNFGQVTGVSQVGGIVGSPVKSRTTVVGCINIGKIDAPADTAANIIGVNIANGKIWDTKNRVDSCWYLESNGVFALDSGHAEGLDLVGLTSGDFGKRFFYSDDYSFPVPVAFSGLDRALLCSAAVVPQGSDKLPKITGSFKVGVPAGVEWTAAPGIVKFSGNDADFTANYTGALKLIASIGSLQKEFDLDVAGVVSVGETFAGSEVAQRIFFDLSGLQVNNPQPGQIYLVKTIFTDGREEIKKMVAVR